MDSAYFLGDALGSVRQLVDGNGAVALAKNYEPYGEVLSEAGSGASSYGYTGEWASNDLIYLRSRFYQSSDGRFLTKDSWRGSATIPMSSNAWLYGSSNPINLSDPSGHDPYWCENERTPEARQKCYAKWLYGYGGLVRTDLTGTYNRKAAVAFALTHDLNDKFPDDGYFDFPNYDSQCTMFVSSALSKGGYPTSSNWPGYEGTKLDANDPNDSGSFYVNRGSKGMDYEHAWINTPELYNYLKSNSNNEELTPASDGSVDFTSEDWIKWLNNNLTAIMYGDVVFYQSEHDRNIGIAWGHAAMVVGWGSKTHYKEDFEAEMNSSFFETIECASLWKDIDDLKSFRPLVVERSGAIQYATARSIDNTFSKTVKISIIHIR